MHAESRSSEGSDPGYGAGAAPPLDLAGDLVALTRQLIDVRSVSGVEAGLADAVQGALAAYPHLTVERIGNTVVARTSNDPTPGAPTSNDPTSGAPIPGARDVVRQADGAPHDGEGRVLLAGHLDTVPEAGNLPSRLTDQPDGRAVSGLGACDMKGGLAVALRLAATMREPRRPVTYVCYDCEEVEAERNGLGRLAAARPELLEADFAVLMEPSSAEVEAGCQGTLRAEVLLRGRRAHSARSWKGENAVHAAGEVLRRLSAYEPRRVDVDGLVYREGLNAVGITGGVAGNVIPDECRVTVNYRFAPSRSTHEALAHVREVFDGFEVALADSAPGALPGLDRPPAREFLGAVDATPMPKFGWTDVARFSALGVPAVNYGPGDSSLAHTQDEYVPVDQLYRCEQRLRDWLS